MLNMLGAASAAQPEEDRQSYPPCRKKEESLPLVLFREEEPKNLYPFDIGEDRALAVQGCGR
jgi:hypothetical protein